MRLPILLSVPHAGLDVPPEVAEYCVLTPDEIVKDGDEGAGEIYALEAEVEAFQTTTIARAIVDLNRAEDDRRQDGVVKTDTCWSVPVYREPLRDDVISTLLDRYYHPYHLSLSEHGRNSNLRLAVDCHTMAAAGPPVGPDPGSERPWICLSDADGTCPRLWTETLKTCLDELIDGPVTINDPFRGGFITRFHASEMPWLQLEMSRGQFLSNADKRELVLSALTEWIRRIDGGQ